ncbi:rhomboid family intramembrane serine protease [Neptunitalea lumnitzerae]|uniref:Rhomboid family intramembrane serine protease n=1 Tax=Neptunitalea lumnitzerae TaxID=2965509 RepID=A0ABQ5MLZ9_9FLAO|nr:rhomboid family intramembrane serine protease [Neptunitalea sp. Y10]GLB50377.1 rhomboid family intramembrane serine protease [Neptunitalea sp. Y10]
MGRMTEVVKHLIIINVLFFVVTFVMKNWHLDVYLALWFPENSNFKIWQIVTHMFMHGGLMHILFNMYALFAFGSPLEMMWGKNKFLFFYLSAGIGAALIYTAANYYFYNEGMSALITNGYDKVEVLRILSEGKYDTDWGQYMSPNTLDNFIAAVASPAVGASGAIYGVLVAFAMSFPDARLMMIFLPIPIKAKYFVPGIIVMDLFFGLTSYSMGPVAHFAHVGGAIIGFVMMWYWRRNQFDNNRWN